MTQSFRQRDERLMLGRFFTGLVAGCFAVGYTPTGRPTHRSRPTRAGCRSLLIPAVHARDVLICDLLLLAGR